MSIEEWGWDFDWKTAFSAYEREGLRPGRVIASHPTECRLAIGSGEVGAHAAGRLRHGAEDPAAFPATGDWVAVAVSSGTATIEAVLPRRTRLSRRSAGTRPQEQVIAANVDTVFLVAGLDADFNPRRIERTLATAWESGAAPVLVLTKADLCEDLARRRTAAEGVAGGVPIVAISAVTGDGVDELAGYLAPGRTGVLIGSSGVGKSTLVNRLIGDGRQATQPVRAADGRGRHTTTRRELIRLPGGGLLIDTPGLREIQLWASDDALGRSFEDVRECLDRCRFRDCRHVGEPGCAIRRAIDAGVLPVERFESYRKLEAELRHRALRDDGAAQRERKARWKEIHKDARRRRR